MREHLIRTAALSALLLGAGVAHGAVVSLPPQSVVEMMQVPPHAPAHVNAGARVSGIFVARDPAPGVDPENWQFRLFTSPRDAAEFAAKGYVEPGREKPAPDPCVFVADDPKAAGEAWPASAATAVRRSSSVSNPPPILGIHLETLHGDGTPDHPASLDVVDAWFDTRTRGLKLVSRSTLALAPVAEGPLRVRVLAARAANAVHLVVLPPAHAGAPFGEFFERAIIQSGGEVGMSECRHSRVSLEANAGTGENADVVFQQSEPMPPEPGDPKTQDESSGFPAPSQLRVLRVHLSASRNTDATAPIVSVSFHFDPLKPIG